MEAALFGKRSIDAETVKFDVYCGSEFHEYLAKYKTNVFCVCDMEIAMEDSIMYHNMDTATLGGFGL